MWDVWDVDNDFLLFFFLSARTPPPKRPRFLIHTHSLVYFVDLDLIRTVSCCSVLAQNLCMPFVSLESRPSQPFSVCARACTVPAVSSETRFSLPPTERSPVHPVTARLRYAAPKRHRKFSLLFLTSRQSAYAYADSDPPCLALHSACYTTFPSMTPLSTL
jgi:hypothetical protein